MERIGGYSSEHSSEMEFGSLGFMLSGIALVSATRSLFFRPLASEYLFSSSLKEMCHNGW